MEKHLYIIPKEEKAKKWMKRKNEWMKNGKL